MDNYTNEKLDDNVQKNDSYAVENELRKTIQRQKKTIFRLAERNRVWKIICAVMAVVVVIESMVLWINSADNGANVPTTATNENVVAEQIESQQTKKPVDLYEQKINDIMSKMSLADKIYHMLFVTPEALTGYENVTAAGEATQTKLSDKKIGGLIYNSTNFETKEQVLQMMTNVKSYSVIVPFIATVEDGENSSQLKDVKSENDYKLPSVSDIAAFGTNDKMVEEYYKNGQNLLSFGFNTNYYAPQGMYLNDVDISVSSSVSGCSVNGYAKSGISSIIKGFPTMGDSDKNVDQLKNREFEIYNSLIASDADMIVLSNGVNKNFAGEEIPYSLAGVTYDTLKKNLGFKGVIVSNAFDDEKITDKYTTSEIVIKSINSGCNMFFCSSDTEQIVTAINDAVKSGEIQQSSIDDSVKKILSVKLKRAIIEYGLKEIYWCVSKKNERAVRFYDKHLYERAEIVPHQILSNYTEEQNRDFIWYIYR